MGKMDDAFGSLCRTGGRLNYASFRATELARKPHAAFACPNQFGVLRKVLPFRWFRSTYCDPRLIKAIITGLPAVAYVSFL
jgi:hypothetical protein